MNKLLFRKYPKVDDLHRELIVSREDAEYLHVVCDVSDPALRVVLINDAAFAVLNGWRVSELSNVALRTILTPPIYEREH